MIRLWHSCCHDAIAREYCGIVPGARLGTPLMIDGVLYLTRSLSQAVALDAATGETVWIYDGDLEERRAFEQWLCSPRREVATGGANFPAELVTFSL